MIDGQSIFDQPVRNVLLKHDTFEKLQQVKEMITQLAICWTIFQKTL